MNFTRTFISNTVYASTVDDYFLSLEKNIDDLNNNKRILYNLMGQNNS